MKTVISFIFGGLVGVLLTCTLQSSSVNTDTADYYPETTPKDQVSVNVCVTSVEKLPIKQLSKFSGTSSESNLLIPEKSIVGMPDNPQVYTLNSNYAYLRPIEIGESVGGMRVVLKGLTAGTLIINEIVNQLENGSRVNVVNRIETVSPEFDYEEMLNHTARRK